MIQRSLYLRLENTDSSLPLLWVAQALVASGLSLHNLPIPFSHLALAYLAAWLNNRTSNLTRCLTTLLRVTAGRCLRRGNCPFVHSRDTVAAEGYQFKRNADKRPAKRLAPGTQTSPRPALRHKPAGLSQYDRTEATAGARGRRKVQGSWDEEGASSASVGGGSGGGNSSSRAETGDRKTSPQSWQLPANDNRCYFFGGGVGLGRAGASATAASPGARPHRRVEGSQRDVVTCKYAEGRTPPPATTLRSVGHGASATPTRVTVASGARASRPNVVVRASSLRV